RLPASRFACHAVPMRRRIHDCLCVVRFATTAKTQRAPRFPAEPSRWLGVKVLCFRYCGGHVTDAPEWLHGVTGTTGPPLLRASMQFLSISWAIRVGFPATVFPSIASWSHAVEIRPFTVMPEHRSNAPPSVLLK